MQRYFDTVQDANGRAVAGATVTVYTSGVVNPLPVIYQTTGSKTAPSVQNNPMTTDPLGNFGFAAPDGTYDIVISGGGIPTKTLANVNLFDGGVTLPSPMMGTVTSVGLSVPSEFAVAGSPVTTSGNISLTLASQAANTVWAGPASGSASAPALRSLVTNDLPNAGTAGTYGSATQIPVMTTDAKGRVTNVTPTTVTPAWSSITGTPTTLAGYGITDATFDVASIQNQVYVTGVTTGTAPTYAISLNPAVTAYVNGLEFEAIFNVDNGAFSPTLNVNSIGNLSLKQYNSSGTKIAATIKAGIVFKIRFDGTDLVVLNPLPPSVPAGTGRLIGYQVFTANGSYTKATNNPSFVIVEVQGGGGSGGVASSTSGPRLATGGAAGGYTMKKIAAASLAASETVTVGAAGAAVTSSGSNGNAGGTSSFGSHCSATGGAAGAFKNSTGTQAGAVGGSASGGDVNSLGGGSSALFAAGTEFNATAGGSSRFGGGGAAIASTSASAQTGIAGGIGAGGGGTVVNTSTAGHSSGAGGDGIVIVWEYA